MATMAPSASDTVSCPAVTAEDQTNSIETKRAQVPKHFHHRCRHKFTNYPTSLFSRKSGAAQEGSWVG